MPARLFWFARVRPTTTLIILGLATAAIGLSMATPALEEPELQAAAPVNSQPNGDTVTFRGVVIDPGERQSSKIISGSTRSVRLLPRNDR
jgi:hypothetical protein